MPAPEQIQYLKSNDTLGDAVKNENEAMLHGLTVSMTYHNHNDRIAELAREVAVRRRGRAMGQTAVQSHALLDATGRAFMAGAMSVSFDREFGQRLGFSVASIALLEGFHGREVPVGDELQPTIDWADLLYVSGGNAQYMLQRWLATGQDWRYRKALEAGTVISGHSGGFVQSARFAASNSNHLLHGIDKDAPFVLENETAMGGLLYAMACPHADSEPHRQLVVEQFITSDRRSKEMVALELDDEAALLIRGNNIADRDGRVEVLTEQPGAKVARVFMRNGELFRQAVRPTPGESYELEDFLSPKLLERAS